MKKLIIKFKNGTQTSIVVAEHFSREQAFEIFKRDNYTCQYCNKVGGILECDHVIPYSKGGSNDITNLITSCRKCNRQKKDKSVEEFITWKLNKL